MNHLLSKTGSVILILSLALISNDAKAQVPTGQWTGTAIPTTTDKALGIGVTQPNGWQEIRYCPPLPTDHCGLIVTKSCNGATAAFNPANPDNIGGGIQEAGEGEGEETFTLPYSFLTGNATNGMQPTYSSSLPLMWLRIEDPPFSTFNPNPYPNFDTKFIVMPDGSVGVNIAHPRAALDVRGSQGIDRPAFILGSRAIGTGTIDPGTGLFQYHTQQVHFIPILSENGYNRISQANDQGMFFSDGKGVDGANLGGAFIIAPWAEDNDDEVGGLRIDPLGNLEVHGDLRATKVKVDAKWWSDFVFAPDYSLMSLGQLETFIHSHGHLPGMPAEAELLENGIDVAHMQALQQQKIEELTLYIIQLQKEIEALRAIMESSNR